MKSSESKYLYTAKLMNQALIEILEKKDIDFISITEITKKAGVNRSTFYLHYDNVYDLLEETIENINKEFVDSFVINSPINIQSKETAFFLTEDFLIPYLNFCKRNKRLLKLVHQKPTLFQNKKAYKKMYEKIFYPAISQFITEENERIYKLEFFTRGVVGVINKWIELDCRTEIEIIIDIIKNCIGYNFNK